MLPCIERLIEKLVHRQFNGFIQSNGLLNKHQSGFRAQHSCESAINDVLCDWREAQNTSKIIIAIFLDFQRAFETIDPDLLVYILKQYGVQEMALKWFESYLKNRKQTVKIGDTISNELENNLGVPQGSILGPLLFILYINFISSCLKYCSVKMFADDTLVYLVADSAEEAMQKINEDLILLYDKLCQYKLKLNVEKTKVVVITNKKIEKNNINIFMNGTRLDIESEIKYLGVIIDNELKFDKNIDHVCKKIGIKVNVLSRLRNELNTRQKIHLYKTLIQPHFTYCASILYLSSDASINRLQNLQIKCMRQILSANKTITVETLFENLNFMNVNQTIVFRTLLFIYKIVKGQAPSYLTDRIKCRNEIHKRNLRNGDEIEVTTAMKACSQNSLFYKGIRLFNSIPKVIRDAENFAKLEKLLETHVRKNF